MDTKTKINTIISIVLITLITAVVYWIQLPADNLKAQIVDYSDTVLVRIQDYAFDPDIVRVDTNTTVSWLNDETEANADVQHIIVSYDPEDPSAEGEEFESDYLNLGDTFSYNFNEEGVRYYNDSLYPFMLGKVCVGEASEMLDEDCAIDLTDTAATVDDEDLLSDDDTLELDDEADDSLLPAAVEDEDDATTDDEDADDEDDFMLDVTEEMQTIDEDEMFAPQVTTNDDVMVVDVRESPAKEEYDKELTDSGPEYLIYLLVGIFAMYSARKYIGFNS